MGYRAIWYSKKSHKLENRFEEIIQKSQGHKSLENMKD